MADERVLQVQQWLNKTYGNDSRYNKITEDGKTGWSTIYALRRALQIELGIQETSNSFGPTTYSLCPTIAQGSEGNLVYIVQGGLWCKGYNPGGFTGYYGNGTYNAVKQLKTDAGFPSASGNMQRDFMKALLDMSAFTCLAGGTEEIRTIQQRLNYDYYNYYQICPCDGLYNRDMNKMLIYALQKELGISKSSATGTWGTKTTSLCKAQSFGIGDTDNIIKLIRYATVCNGYYINVLSSTYDSSLDYVLEAFCDHLKLIKPNNRVNYTVIKSLLSSNGDTDRSALGCDTATKLTTAQIHSIKNAGYQYVGRYLTNTPGGTLDKCLTVSEIDNILNAGLKLFAIFQESGDAAGKFTRTSGKNDGEKAYVAAREYGFSTSSTIYFAVDFDPTDDIIQSNIIPYFKGILASNARKYRIGVYGTRNVCNKLHDNSDLKINKFFVSDASYGFSGNLGFNIPGDWCFDQFCTDITIGSGNGTVRIDKVGVSGKDIGISKVVLPGINKFYNYLTSIYDLAYNYCHNISESNSLVLQYFRKLGNYGGNWFGTSNSVAGEASNIQWNLVAGEIDNDFCDLVESTLGSDIPKFKDPSTQCYYDFNHLAATLQSNIHVFIDTENEGLDTFIDLFSGWMGDLTTFAKDIETYVEKNKNIMYQEYANNNLFAPDTSFSMEDYIADIDGINLARSLLSNSSMKITDLFYNYFMNTEYGGTYSSERTQLWITRVYGNYSSFKNQSDYLNQNVEPVSTFRLLLNKTTVSDEAFTAAHTAFNNYVYSCLD